MTDPIEIDAHEREVVRVFHIDLPADEVEAFATRDADGRWPLKDALGAEHLDPDRVEVFPLKDLAGLGLSGYLVDGLGVAQADVAPRKEALDRLAGHVMVVTSSAFEGQAQVLRPDPPISLVATFRERPAEPAGPPLRSLTADGPIAAEEEAPRLPDPGARPPQRGLISAIIFGAILVAALLIYLFGAAL